MKYINFWDTKQYYCAMCNLSKLVFFYFILSKLDKQFCITILSIMIFKKYLLMLITAIQGFSIRLANTILMKNHFFL